jgi:hypothetical protein
VKESRGLTSRQSRESMTELTSTAVGRAVRAMGRLGAFLGIKGSVATDAPVTPASDVDVSCLVRFIEELARVPRPTVVELGTRRQEGQQRSRHHVWVPHADQYIGVDYEPGDDVDLVADAHELSRHVPCSSVDAVVSCSTFEHIKYPWIAALEIAKVLKIGGLILIQAPQTFALHAFPHDYWRFSTEGLKTLFPPALGFEVLSCHYQYPCQIVSPDDPTQSSSPSYLSVCLVARKIGPAPDTFILDLSRSL